MDGSAYNYGNNWGKSILLAIAGLATLLLTAGFVIGWLVFA